MIYAKEYLVLVCTICFFIPQNIYASNIEKCDFIDIHTSPIIFHINDPEKVNIIVQNNSTKTVTLVSTDILFKIENASDIVGFRPVWLNVDCETFGYKSKPIIRTIRPGSKVHFEWNAPKIISDYPEKFSHGTYWFRLWFDGEKKNDYHWFCDSDNFTIE